MCGIRGLQFGIISPLIVTLSYTDGNEKEAQAKEDLSFMVRKLQDEYRKSGLELTWIRRNI